MMKQPIFTQFYRFHFQMQCYDRKVLYFLIKTSLKFVAKASPDKFVWSHSLDTQPLHPLINNPIIHYPLAR